MDFDKQAKHNVFISDRKYAELCAIDAVDSYDSNGIVCSSSCGGISIEGEELKIESFSVDSGKLCVTGRIDGIYYFPDNPTKGIFGKRKK